MTPEEIAARIRPYLEAERLDDIRFEVHPEDILTGDNWYRVPVHPSHLPERLYRLYDVLAELEFKIREEQGLAVLLLIGEPLEEREAPVAIAAGT